MTTVSFLITVHDEAFEIKRLVDQLSNFIEKNSTQDEIVIIDDFSTDLKTKNYLDSIKSKPFIKVHQHFLNGDFGAHKQWGTEQCTKDFIFQIDADEYFSEELLSTLHDLIEANQSVDLYRIPRVNIVRGLTENDAKNWGWRVFGMNEYPGLPIVNWPDWQSRLYRRDSKIKWIRRLHETVSGAEYVTDLPSNPNWSIVHDKSIEKQRSQNDFYNKNWSKNENLGRG